ARSLGIGVPPPALRTVEPLAGKGATLRVPAQDFVAGWQGAGFAFDNELQPVRVHLPAFEIDAEPVSENRFAEFVAAGGYRERRWWDDAGWAWLQQNERPQHGRPK